MEGLKYLNVAVVVALAVVSQRTDGCTDQSGCFCFDDYVTCFGLTKFPTSFPENTTTVRINNMTVDQLPADVFHKLPLLVAVEISESTIGRLAPNTFSDMSEVELINFRDVAIETIESYAFSNLIDIGTISLYMSTVGTIQEYAFTNIFALDELSLFSSNITTIEKQAFYDIDEVLNFNFYSNNVGTMESHAVVEVKNLDTLDMYLNTFGMLGCGVVEPLITNSRESSFYSNSAPCDCRLSWVLDSARLHDHLFSNWCRLPGAGDRVYFSDLTTETLLCDLDTNTGCPDVTTTTQSTVVTNPPTKNIPKHTTTKSNPISYKTRASAAETTVTSPVTSTTESSAREDDFQNDYPAVLNTPDDNDNARYVYVSTTNDPTEDPTMYKPKSRVTTTDDTSVEIQSPIVVSGNGRPENADNRRHKPTRLGHKKRAKDELKKMQAPPLDTTTSIHDNSITSSNTTRTTGKQSTVVVKHTPNGTNKPSTVVVKPTPKDIGGTTNGSQEDESAKLGVYNFEHMSGARSVSGTMSVIAFLVTSAVLLPMH